MATKHITDAQVLQAYDHRRKNRGVSMIDILQRTTGECEKVCFRAMERAHRRGYTDYGVSLNAAWLTDKGELLLAELAS